MTRDSWHFRHRRAFTLIELLVVIAIIGILAALLLPVLVRVRCSGRAAAAKGTIQSLTASMEAFSSDFGVYPENEASFELVIRSTAADFQATGAPKPVGAPAKLRMRHLTPPSSVASMPKGRMYFEAKTDDIDPATGDLMTGLGFPFWYQEWSSKAVKAGAKKPFAYDIWSHDCMTADQSGAPTTFKNPPSETAVNNWQ